MIAAATALHWFDERRLGELFRDFFALLRDGGVIVFAEPVAVEAAFSSGHALWQKADEAACEMQGAAWTRFWDRARALTGCDQRTPLEAAPGDRRPIGDAGIPMLGCVELLQRAGFQEVDVLLREPTTATFAAIKRLSGPDAASCRRSRER